MNALVLLATATALQIGAGLDPALRTATTTSLDGEWRYIIDQQDFGSFEFYKDLKPDGKRLQQHDYDRAPAMKIPTDWNTADPQLFFYEGQVWFRRTFQAVRKPNRRAVLRFGAVNYKATVWLDGKELGTHEGGFTPFGFDITEALTNVEHSLVLRVDNVRKPERVPCESFDWWNYGGIIRGVSLLDLPENYIVDATLQCVKGNTKKVAGYVQLAQPKAGVRVVATVPELQLVMMGKTDAKGRAAFESAARPRLWSPERPYLTKVVFAIEGDALSDEIAFRTVETRGKQILLNGKPVFLRGICMHDEKLGGGRVSRAEDVRPLFARAKELGCNYLRLAHYPHNDATIREAERQGILLWSEIPLYWNIKWENTNTYANAEKQLGEMIARDRNRGNIIIWSLANETMWGDARNKFLQNLSKKARALDDTRLISMAMLHGDLTNNVITVSDTIGPWVDVVSFNEYLCWYWSDPATTEKVNFNIPFDKPVIVSEFGGAALGGSHGLKTERWTEEFQAEIYRANLAMLDRIPGLAGLTPWILADFRSPRRPCPGMQDFYNRKGVITEKGEKKLAFDVIRSYYHKKALQYK